MLTIETVLALETIDKLSDSEVLNVLALLINRANDTADLAVNDRAFHWINVFKTRVLSQENQMIFDYFHANAWGNRQQAKRNDRKAVWAWDQEEIQQQIFLLQRAARNPAFELCNTILRCQILTNLANQFDTVGRMVEARYFWSKALHLEPQFWMARANSGRALMHYGAGLFDLHHQAAFALHAHHEIVQAVSDLDVRPSFGLVDLRPQFVESSAAIERAWNLPKIEKQLNLAKGKLGRSKAEITYRQWCLREGLFLNPLNDISSEPGAAADPLSLPNMIIIIGTAPVLTGLYNQLKQEFVSARWSYYTGVISVRAHYSDFQVDLHDTLDSPIYGLAIEQVKTAFRITYSLFDKLAYFLNRYLDLNFSERDISFRSIWRIKNKATVQPEFDDSENWSFRGLFWLSKDFFEEGYRDFTEPDAQDLTNLRNHLEHKYLKVHRDHVPVPPADPAHLENLFFDNFARSISLTDLEVRTLRLLKLARAALIYLVLGVQHEENRRRKQLPTDEVLPSIGSFPIRDKFKTKI